MTSSFSSRPEASQHEKGDELSTLHVLTDARQRISHDSLDTCQASIVQYVQYLLLRLAFSA